MLAAASTPTPWYTSNAFLTVASIAATLVIGGIGALITYRIGIPRYQLYYELPFCTSLLAAPENARKDIKVSHSGIELHNPHVLKVRLVSRSRADIPSSAFDQDRPIIIDVGIPIVAQLSGDGQEAEFKVHYEGSTLKIGPDLIGKRQEVTFTLLADGPSPSLSCESHLVNVNVKRQPNVGQLIGKFTIALLVSIGFLAAGEVSLAALGILGNSVRELLVWVGPTLMLVFLVIIVALQRRYPGSYSASVSELSQVTG